MDRSIILIHHCKGLDPDIYRLSMHKNHAYTNKETGVDKIRMCSENVHTLCRSAQF